METKRRLILFKIAAMISTNPYQNTVLQQTATNQAALGMQPGPVHQNSIQTIGEQKFPDTQIPQPSTPVSAKPVATPVNRPFAKKQQQSQTGMNGRNRLQAALSRDRKNSHLNNRAQSTMNRATPGGMKAPTTRSIY